MKNILLSMLLLFSISIAQAQMLDPSLNLISTETTKFEELKDLKETIEALDQEIKTKQEEAIAKGDRGDRQGVEQEIRDLEKDKKEYWQQFIELSTGIALADRQPQTDLSKRDILKEMQELVAPMIDTLRRASERPRRIERLKNEIFNLEQDLSPREEALKKIKELILDPRFAEYKDQIDQTNRLLEREIREIQIELSSKERQLKKETGEKKSFMDELKDLSASFFKTKGKNLLFFCLTFVLIFWFALWSRERVFKLKMWETDRFENFVQPLRGLYGFLSFLVALLGAVLCLYVLHDWVLVTLFVILFAGVIWSLKHIFPRFIQEARLILNLGTVREGERIQWNGVSWKVIKLGFQSLVKNESLQGGTMRISSRDLIHLYSRPVIEGEPWFPTKVGDWVYSNETYLAQIKYQTMEQIVVEKLGGGLISMTVSDFWNMKFENLSYGFSITIKCGIDYKFQALVTTEIENKIRRYFEERWAQFSGLLNTEICFHDAGSNSLNYSIRMDFEGRLAQDRIKLEREMQRSFVDACNLYNLNIPFPQMTIHMEQGL